MVRFIADEYELKCNPQTESGIVGAGESAGAVFEHIAHTGQTGEGKV
jgi:hypothetical protein